MKEIKLQRTPRHPAREGYVSFIVYINERTTKEGKKFISHRLRVPSIYLFDKDGVKLEGDPDLKPFGYVGDSAYADFRLVKLPDGVGYPAELNKPGAVVLTCESSACNFKEVDGNLKFYVNWNGLGSDIQRLETKPKAE